MADDLHIVIAQLLNIRFQIVQNFLAVLGHHQTHIDLRHCLGGEDRSRSLAYMAGIDAGYVEAGRIVQLEIVALFLGVNGGYAVGLLNILLYIRQMIVDIQLPLGRLFNPIVEAGDVNDAVVGFQLI